MGRKKKPKFDETVLGYKCDFCETSVLIKSPMTGIIQQVGDKRMVICSNCAPIVVRVHKQMHQRWGI